MRRQKGVPTPESLQQTAKRIYQSFNPTNVRSKLGIKVAGKHLYVYGFTPGKGTPLCWGPITEGGNAEENLNIAMAAAAGLVEGEVFELDTSNLATAKSQIKAELLSRGTNPDAALRRMYSKQTDFGTAKQSEESE